MRSFFLFPKVKQGRFIRRLNRFTVECSLDGEIIRAHLPNPGRLWELLLPDRIVSLVSSDPLSGRSTAYTAVAVLREGMPVLLHTQKANAVVKYLLEKNKIRGLENAEIIRQEAAFGTSRFDFLLQKKNVQYVVEVKSCTLFGKNIAMFPDAVTERGRRHLLKLSELTKQGMKCGVVFLVHSPRARFFLPDYHIDFAFARTFLNLKDRLKYRAVSVTWEENLALGEDVRELDIPREVLNREAIDSGSYMLILHLLDDVTISVGNLGQVLFPRGFYIYVGSAKKNLTKRMERHLRKRKKFFWHIDYLRDHAERCMALPIRSSISLEHEIAFAMNRIADWSIPGFGSSDCSCETHLFAMHDNPVHSQAFIDVLQYFRIDRLSAELH
jgi:sugar fermentation stimulation protein A